MAISVPLRLLGCAFLFSLPACAQVAPDTSAVTCDAAAGCSQAALHGAMASATTVAIQTPPRDRFAHSQLDGFVKKLGKQVALPQRAADLTFVLAEPSPTGVAIGPGDRELGTLRVYSGKTGKLVWVERLTGSGDRAWPAAVDQLLTQFKGTLAAAS